MPGVWDKAAFDGHYDMHAEYGYERTGKPIRLHYHRYVMNPLLVKRAAAVFDLLGLQAGQDVVLVGCAFNWMARALADLGVRVIGVDTSAYVLGSKDGSEESELRDWITAVGVDPDNDLIRNPAGGQINPLDLYMEGGRASPAARGWGQILDQDLRTNGSQNSVISAFESQYPNAAIRYILTEEVINSITDAQAALVCEYCQGAATRWGATVVHLLSPAQPGIEQDADLNWKTYAEWRAWLDANGFTGQQVIPTVSAAGQGMNLPDRDTIIARVLVEAASQGFNYPDSQARATKAGDDYVTVQRVRAYSGVF